jgi:cobalt-zinc-cadmium resistance protein CzcA
MIDRIISFALRQRFLLVIGSLGLVGFGVLSMRQLDVDAFPDVTNVQVQVNTEAPGLAAVEVERLITFPVESVMSSLPGVNELRSTSKTGLSVVTVVFEDNVDIYFARQLVFEQLQLAQTQIPAGVGEPEMGAISTGLGQVYMYKLESKDKSLMELRTINDWLVKPQLRTVPGVTEVLSFGGEVRQYQVQFFPNRLLEYDLTFEDLKHSIAQNNTNAGGWYIEGDTEQLVVRGEGLIHGGDEGLSDIADIVVKTVDGTAVRIKDLADVHFGPEIRQGVVTMNGEGEVVLGIALKLKGANTMKVIEGIRQRLPQIQDSLPREVKIVPVYDQADLVEKAISTVTESLGEAAVLIVIVLLLYLGNLRSALIVVSSIPLSILIAFIMMRWYGLSANLQSLGGLAIGIGMMVDGSVVIVENIVRHLSEPCEEELPIVHRVEQAAREVANPVCFAVLIIVVVFLPLFTLQGVEGKLFSPMAFTIAFAMLGSLVVALTIVPVLATFAFRGRHVEKESPVVRILKAGYRPVLRSAVKHPVVVVGVAVFGLVASLVILPTLGTEFVPELDEGTLSIRVTMAPSISLEEAKRIAQRMEAKLLHYPEVQYAFSQIGRAELGGEPEGLSNNEIFVGLKPQGEWETADSREKLIQTLREDLADYPGVMLNFSQPIESRVDELLSGIKAQIAVKLFGEDLDVLARKGDEIRAVVAAIPGATDVQMEQISGEAQLVVQADRKELARYGLNAAQAMDVVSGAVGGEAVTQVIEGKKRFDVYLRVAEQYRHSSETIGQLLIDTENGLRVPLSQVAAIRIVDGAPAVNHEDAERRAVIQCNVRGRDMGGFVAEAQQAVKRQVGLPPGYYVTWGGQFENQQRAQRTLMIVVPICLGLIFLLLFMSFGSVRNALLIIMNVPFALIGGVLSLAVSGQYLSVPSSVGFIALFGVAVLNGVVLVSYFDTLLQQGLAIEDAVLRGALLRLRPVLMTATVASLGLVPLLLSHGIGSEVQRPLATVVIGGLITSTLLTLLVLPSVYRWITPKPIEVEI